MAIDESMPKGWFFEIHEDTPEQEAANLMEHSASVLDISSDDDADTKAKLDELSRGKENVPPPDFALTQPRSASANVIDDGEETEIEEPVKKPRMRKITLDSMDEDRRPLGDLQPSDFYGAGCDASSYVTVDVGIERPSRLSKEVNIHVDSASENINPVKRNVKSAPVVEESTSAKHVAEPKNDAAATSPQSRSTSHQPTSQSDTVETAAVQQ